MPKMSKIHIKIFQWPHATGSPLRSYVPFVYSSTLFRNKTDAQSMITVRFYSRPNDCKSCCKYGWKMHKKMHQNHWKLVHWLKQKLIFPWAHAFGPRPNSKQSVAPSALAFESSVHRKRIWLRLFSYASLFLTQVCLNFRAILKLQHIQLQIFLKNCAKSICHKSK